MRVLIFEPQFAGHNLGHAARLIHAVGELPCEICLATSRPAAESQEFELHVGPHRERLTLEPVDGFRTDKLGRRVRTTGLRGMLAQYFGLRRVVERVRPDHVYVPYANQLARLAAAPLGLAAALRRAGAEAEAMLVGGGYCYPQRRPLARLRQKATLRAIAAGPWRTVFHMDEAAVAETHRHGERLARLFRLIPDPHSALPPRDRRAARAALGLPESGRLIGVVGLIESRKGIAQLLAAVRDAGDRLRPDDRLALFGRFHPQVWELLRGEHAGLLAAGRVLTDDRLLSNREMTDAVSALDVVAALYPFHRYTSSVLATAAKLQRPVLGSTFGWIGRTVERFQLGHTCDALDPPDVARALVASLEASDGYQTTAAGRRFIEYLSDENYAATWTARLRERLGEPPHPDLRTWEWAASGAARRGLPRSGRWNPVATRNRRRKK